MKKRLTLCVLAFLCLCAGPVDRFEESAKRVRPAIEQVESGGNPDAYNASEDAAGILQIRRIMVDDVNRILAGQKSTKRFTYEDRWDADKSREIFAVYSKYYAKHHKDYSCEGIARRWCGGPTGHKKTSSIEYWKRVGRVLNGDERTHSPSNTP